VFQINPPRFTVRCLPPLLAILAQGCGLSTSRVHVNQVGYLPQSEKVAIIESSSKVPENWELLEASGKVVAHGVTEVRGQDSEAGESLHWARFGALTQPASGLSLRVGEDVSSVFSIRSDLYHQLKYDALAYFYHNRSGTPIAMPWVKDAKWSRPAGHLSDAQVPCVAHFCPYQLDVQGGWYDAGDFGKYVVNGGIALWTLLNLYERLQTVGTTLDDFADGKLSIPESNNKVPDLLDEARWEMEFLLKMQIPQGRAKAGMAFHKIHDNYWTPLGQVPPSQSRTRFLYPPSTAATLNLVATAAQCSRIWRTIDPPFSERCRVAAIRGWNAAHEFPRIYASPMSSNGGGPYEDANVTDEFYWAAAELFISLGDPKLLRYLQHSPFHGKFPSQVGQERVSQHTSMTWQSTQALGSISLALVPNNLPESELNSIRAGIVKAADDYLRLAERRGYRVPMQVGADSNYPWGSNSFVANNGIILALAADISKKAEYAQGAIQAMDYLLGVNPLGFSYVSGYGTRYLQNPHHRFWAHQKSGRCPSPPPGALAGGPNSKLVDPKSQHRISGCAPERCYTDDVDAYGVNEVAINWNAPLAWLAAWVDERGQGKPTRDLWKPQAAKAESQ